METVDVASDTAISPEERARSMLIRVGWLAVLFLRWACSTAYRGWLGPPEDRARRRREAPWIPSRTLDLEFASLAAGGVFSESHRREKLQGWRGIVVGEEREWLGGHWSRRWLIKSDWVDRKAVIPRSVTKLCRDRNRNQRKLPQMAAHSRFFLPLMVTFGPTQTHDCAINSNGLLSQ